MLHDSLLRAQQQSMPPLPSLGMSRGATSFTCSRSNTLYFVTFACNMIQYAPTHTYHNGAHTTALGCRSYFGSGFRSGFISLLTLSSSRCGLSGAAADSCAPAVTWLISLLLLLLLLLHAVTPHLII
jgi:hypothetical protein